MIVSAETAKIQQLREEYEKQGYRIIERPGPEEFPFEAGYSALLWTALEGVLRRMAVDDGMPVDRLPASTLIPALYDYGLIPMKAYERLKAAHEVHRRVRHGYHTPEEKVAEAVRAVSEWLPQLLPHAVERAA